MRPRIRDIVILVAGLAVLLAVALGGYAAVRARAQGSGASQVLAPVPQPTPAPSGAVEPQYDRWTVGVAQRPLTVYRRADADAPVRARLPMHTSADYPMVVLVDGIKEVGGVTWYKVWIPVPPNETSGWVREGQLALYSTSSKIVIDLSERKLSVYRAGKPRRALPGGGRQARALPRRPGASTSPRSSVRRTRTASTASCSWAPAPSSPS